MNARGAGNVARAAREIGARLIHLSTDFVFDGCQGAPTCPGTRPTRSACTAGPSSPASARWSTRSAAGRSCCAPPGSTRRTAATSSSPCCGDAGARRGRRGGRPGRLAHLGPGAGRALWPAAARPDVRGVLHWTDAGVASWYDFAVAIQEEAMRLGLLAASRRCTRSAPASFPPRRGGLRSACSTTRPAALDGPPAHWRANLRRMLEELPRG